MVNSDDEEKWMEEQLIWELRKLGPLHLSIENPWKRDDATLVNKSSLDVLEINQREAAKCLEPYVKTLKFFYLGDSVLKFDSRIFSLRFPVTDNKTGIKYALYLFAVMRPGGDVLVYHSRKDYSTLVSFTNRYPQEFICNFAEVVKFAKDNDTDGIDYWRNINFLANSLAYALMSCYSGDLEKGFVSVIGYVLEQFPDFLYYAIA